MARWPEPQPQNDSMEFVWNSLSPDAQRVSLYIAKPISFTHEAVDRNYLLICAQIDRQESRGKIKINVDGGLAELRGRGVLAEDPSLLDFYRRQLRTLLEESSQKAQIQNRQLRQDEREAINERLRKVVEYQKNPSGYRHMEQPQYYLIDDLQQFMERNFVFLGGEETMG